MLIFTKRTPKRKRYVLFTIKGKYADAKIFTTESRDTAIDQYAVAQLQMLCDSPVSEGSKIRIMPDVHPGKICTIGLTMTVGNNILPNLIGVDIGCGITVTKLNKARMDFRKLDVVIRDHVPAGFAIRDKALERALEFELSRLHCAAHIQNDKAQRSLGTLGSGNHFIEIDRDDDGSYYLVVHTGSRHLGQEITEHYLKKGAEIIAERGETVPYELTYLEGRLFNEYLHDLMVACEYADLNRSLIIKEILKGMKWKSGEMLSVRHNYISEGSEGLLLRKGAISAHEGEPVVIPINMKDGVILGTGLGNEDWNCSAPHGSGRLIRRDEVKNSHSVAEFRSAMKDVYSSCIGADTLDEAPFAYRDIEEITAAIQDTVKIDRIIRPVYSFKAGNRK